MQQQMSQTEVHYFHMASLHCMFNLVSGIHLINVAGSDLFVLICQTTATSSLCSAMDVTELFFLF